MSNEENKTEKSEKPETSKSAARGERGELGKASAGLTILQRWREATHRREDANDRHNHNKRIFVRLEGTPSLKQFAKALLKEGDPVAKEWYANKRGANRQKTTDANIKAAKEAAMASKAARSKKK